jgi:NAD(P)-dependent dehydrogenase (short-subunit alcohol dehydrogenase family)
MDKSKYISKINGHALVLGGSGGIGYEVVMALVANGASAISFSYDSNKEKADALVKTLEADGIRAFAAKINQSDEASIRNFLDSSVKAMGEEISVAVNAIGISPNKQLRQQALETTDSAYDDKGWREIFEVNVFGCFISSRAIATRMEEKGVEGSLVIITSTNGVNSQSSISTHYDSSKAAQIMMMKGLAEEFAHSVRINGIAPGWVNTKMNATLPPEEKEKETAKIWLERFAEPHEIAGFIAYVCGNGGSYMTGQNIMIDGGYR